MGSSVDNPLIIDYGLGNLLSLSRALEKVGSKPQISSSPSDVAKASRLILPGVGSFSQASRSLHQGGFAEEILDSANRGIPILGICLGMQLLFDQGHENGVSPGLGLIAGSVQPIFGEIEGGLPRTHIGWRYLDLSGTVPPNKTRNELLNGPFYFVHSYAAVPADPQVVRASVRYGFREVAAVIQKDNIVGVQFHPEKSANRGLALLRAFCASDGTDGPL